MKNPFEHATRYTESKKMFFVSQKESSIVSKVNKLDIVNTLVTLAKTVWILEDNDPIDPTVQASLAKELIARPWHIRASKLLEQGENFFFRPQIHIAMKYVAKYAERNSPTKPLTSSLMHKLGYVLFAITDLISKQSEMLNDEIEEEDLIKRLSIRLFTGEYFVYTRNPLLDIARIKLMFVYYHENFNLNDTVDFVELDHYFKAATGLTIEKYLHIGFGFIVRLMEFRNLDSLLPDDKNFIIFQPKAYFNNTNISKDEVTKMFNFLSLSVEEVGSLIDIQTKREIAYDFLDFLSHPFIELNNGGIIPVSFYYAVERFTAGIYWIILDHLSQTGQETEKQKFMRYNGFLFEQLVADIAKELFNRIPDDAKSFYADEIYIRDGTEVKTSDVMLVTKNDIVLLEATAARISAKRTIVDGQEEAFFDDCEKIIFKKAKELDRCIKDLRNGKVTISGKTIDGNKHIYPLIVVIEGFPQFPVINEFLNRELQEMGVFNDERIAQLGILSADELTTVARFRDIDILDLIKDWQSSKFFPGITLEDFLAGSTNLETKKESEWWSKNVEQIWNDVTMEIFGKPFTGLEN